MGYDFERSMDDVVDVVRRAKEQDGAVILLGAGCSKTAGIPLASDFRAIIEKRFPLDYARAARRKETGYQQLMAEISAGERRDLLAEYIDKAKLNWAHIALAELIKGGFIARAHAQLRSTRGAGVRSLERLSSHLRLRGFPDFQARFRTDSCRLLPARAEIRLSAAKYRTRVPRAHREAPARVPGGPGWQTVDRGRLQWRKRPGL
jgi:hypothetical protein